MKVIAANSSTSQEPQQAGQKYVDKKRLAIESAAKVFAEHGFHGATTQDIATQMGIKQGSLYYYFKSKEQALQDVCEYGIERYVERMRKICAREQPFEAKLQMIIISHLSNYRQNNNAMKVHNDQRLYLPKERRARLKELGTSYRSLLEQTISDATSEGVVSAGVDAHFVAYSVIGICNAWGANLMRDPSLDLYETIGQCADLVLHGILSN